MDIFNAARTGDSTKLKGLDINKRGTEGRTALYTAARKNRVNIVECLLKNKADTEVRENRLQWTALIEASALNHRDIVELLLKNKARVNAASRRRRTALYCAADRGHGPVVSLLLHYKADTEITDKLSQRSPLHRACAGDHTKVAAMLLDAGANIESRDKYGSTPVFVAAMYKHPAMVEMLCQRGALINASKTDGTTSVHCAVDKNALNVLNILLKYQPEMKKNKAGKTALDLAKDKKYSGIVSVLEDYTKTQQNAAGNAAPSMQLRPQSGLRLYANTLEAEVKEKKNLIDKQRGASTKYFGIIHKIEAQLKLLFTKIDTIEEKLDSRIEGGATADVRAGACKDIGEINNRINTLPETVGKNKNLGDQHLYHIANKVAATWKHLGANLDTNHDAIERINMDNPNDAVHSAWTMLVQWKNRQTGSVESNKEQLKEALSKIGRRDLSEDI